MMTGDFCAQLILQADSPLPLYYQLQAKIKSLIDAGFLGCGDRLPSEREIAAQTQVNRLTVRQAITALVNEGVLTRKRGLGTFVAPPKLEHGLTKLTSFTEDMHKRGLKPSTRVLSLAVQPVEKKVSLLLGLGAHEDVIVIERLRLADDKPMAFEVAHLPCRRFPGFLALRVDLALASLYDTLRLHYGIEFTRASETLEARAASGREAELLGIPSGAPLLARERTTYGQGDEPIEYVKSLYRADRYRFMYEVIK